MDATMLRRSGTVAAAQHLTKERTTPGAPRGLWRRRKIQRHSIRPKRDGRSSGKKLSGSYPAQDPRSYRVHRRRHTARWLLAGVGVLLAVVARFATVYLAAPRLAPSPEKMSLQGEAVVQACSEVPSPGKNLCAMWVSKVYEQALGRYPTGNANDMYEQLKSTNSNELEPGMALAVATHPHTQAGRQYGHIGIYVGNGLVMDNVGTIRVTPLEWWLWYYGALVPVRWGWL